MADENIVVVTVRGGVCEIVSSSQDVDIVLLDMDNLKAGDPLPDLEQVHMDLIQKKLPDLVEEIRPKFKCEECETGFIDDGRVNYGAFLSRRHVPEGQEPEGECTQCGARVIRVAESGVPA